MLDHVPVVLVLYCTVPPVALPIVIPCEEPSYVPLYAVIVGHVASTLFIVNVPFAYFIL
mgnify:CR=1 FL=1